MGRRLIPNGDQAFAEQASGFARTVARDPGRFAIAPDDAAALSASAARFADALRRARHESTRSPALTRAKDRARADLERLYRRAANVIRLSENIDAGALYDVGIGRPTGKRQARRCPPEPPRLRFVRALHEGASAMPVHELSFCALDQWHGGAKAPGAARIELFVDLVPPDGPVPNSPGDNNGGRQWYLRSFSRSPVRVTPPLARVPMLVVYWGRWADAVGNVGPFSATVVARVEGVSSAMLFNAASGRAPSPILEAPVAREPVYSVAVRDGQFEYPSPPRIAPPSPAPDLPRPRQLEGPPPATEAA